MHATKETYRINLQSLCECLEEELFQAHNFDWTGWRIPIYLDKETGLVSSGNWLSQGSWQPDEHELPIRVKTWSMADHGYEGKLVDETTPENEEGNYTNADMRMVIREEILDSLIDELDGYLEHFDYDIIDIYTKFEGKLNEFEKHYGKVEFTNHGDTFLLSLLNIDEEMTESPEFWVAQFKGEGGYTYAIAADGAMTSSGKYIVAKTTIQ